MKICYQDKNFSAESLRLIALADKICAEYSKQGYVLTLRQLYYQFVARGHIANTEASYKRIGSLVNDGRLAGLIDWSHLEDRTRNLKALAHWHSPSDIVSACANSYRVDLWKGQESRVEVWVEKEALASVVERAASKWDVPWFCCRGFVSQSEMHAAACRLATHECNGILTHILYLGDHDPSGIEMPKDVDSRLSLFGSTVEVHRIALNMRQIEELNPPPNPAKATDSRFLAYQRQFGDESWELDALPPDAIVRLIDEYIEDFVDEDEMNNRRQEISEGRRLLSRVAHQWDAVKELVR